MTGCCDDIPATPPAIVPPVSWCAGNFTYTFDKGRVVTLPRLPAIADGVYPNATITMVGGCITSIAPGTNIVYSACDPCATPVTPPAPSPIVIDGNSCNLTSDGMDGLVTLLVTGNSNCIALNGCGTAASPLNATPIISTDAGNSLQCRGNGLFVPDPSATTGVDFTGCGIQITNGLITALPLPFAPILNLVSTDGTMLLTQSALDPCTWDLSAIPDPTIVQASQAFRFDTTAELPPQPTGSNGWAAIGAANPREVWMFVQGFGWRQLLDNAGLGCKVNL